MKRQKMLKYVTPKIELLELELEQGIAASSANVFPGGETDPHNPDVEDWKDDDYGPIGGGDFDL